MRAKTGQKRSLWKSATALVLMLLVAYMIVSGAIAYKLWHPVRHPLHTTPAQYGLKYEEVEFTSAGDVVPLKGWYIDSPSASAGTSTIVVMHGISSVRDNYIGMEISRALVQHGYDVF